jgi:hypothetical protein
MRPDYIPPKSNVNGMFLMTFSDKSLSFRYLPDYLKTYPNLTPQVLNAVSIQRIIASQERNGVGRFSRSRTDKLGKDGGRHENARFAGAIHDSHLDANR